MFPIHTHDLVSQLIWSHHKMVSAILSRDFPWLWDDITHWFHSSSPYRNWYGLEHTSLMRQSSLFPRLKSPNSMLLPEVHTSHNRTDQIMVSKDLTWFSTWSEHIHHCLSSQWIHNTCLKLLLLFFFLLHNKSVRRNWDLIAATDSAELKIITWHEIKAESLTGSCFVTGVLQ